MATITGFSPTGGLKSFLIGVTIMAKTPAEILRKTKSTDKKDDNDKDDKSKGSRRNALIDFIAKNKKVAAK